VNAVAAPDWKDVLRSHGFEIIYMGPSENIHKPDEKTRSGVPWESPLMSRRAKSRAGLVKEDFPCLNDANTVDKIMSIKNNAKAKLRLGSAWMRTTGSMCCGATRMTTRW
jgi:hypothetical protein